MTGFRAGTYNAIISMNSNKEAKVYLDTLGCKLNQAETEALARKLAETGWRIVSSIEEADVYVLNTCTVTHVADRKARQLLRQAHRVNPAAMVVALGCYAVRDGEKLARIEGVRLVIGNEQKDRLPEFLKEAGYPTALPRESPLAGRTRTFLKIQDGCRNYCAYCIVPYVRREEKSVPADEVIAGVKKRVAEGYQEIVLTGTEVGTYCHEGKTLKWLLEQILKETDIARVRLSSLQPQEISKEFIKLWEDARLCPHFHLSLQSGSDGVLKRMKRRYTTADYARAVSLIREVVPDAAVTTDIIVGFPGETDAEFEGSYAFCEKIGFSRIHVFSYSPRPTTCAAEMPGQVPDRVKKERSDRMLALAKESARRFHEKFLGREMDVLWEKQENGVWSGYTGNYIKVYSKGDADLTNKLTKVKLEKVWMDGVGGVLLLPQPGF